MKRSLLNVAVAAALHAAINGQPKPLKRCAAGRDGECGHKDCPQLRDNEPGKTGRHCPLDVSDDD